MSLTPQGYIAEKIMSLSGLIVTVLIAFISLFVLFNFNNIANRFGFESKESLKTKLNKSQVDLNNTIDINKELAETNDRLAKENNSLAESCERFVKEETVKADKVKATTVKYNKLRDNVKKKYTKQATDSSERIVTHEEEFRTEVSRVNISQLHASYADLFQQT